MCRGGESREAMERTSVVTFHAAQWERFNQVERGDRVSAWLFVCQVTTLKLAFTNLGVNRTKGDMAHETEVNISFTVCS
jgi:hypothetical protein